MPLAPAVAEAADRIEQLIQVFRGCEGVDDRGTHGTDAVDFGRHDVELTRFDHTSAQFELEVPQLFARRVVERFALVEKVCADELLPSHDMAEGMAAFLEKRAPVWRHA